MCCNIQTLSDLQTWKSTFIDDIFMTVTWSWYILQTRHRMRTTLDISSTTSNATCKLCKTLRCKKIISYLMSSWWLHDLGSIYKTDIKLGPELMSRILHVIHFWIFVRLVGMTKEFHRRCEHDCHMTGKFIDKTQNEDHIHLTP